MADKIAKVASVSGEYMDIIWKISVREVQGALKNYSEIDMLFIDQVSKEMGSRASRLPTLRLITAIHSSRCLKAFHCLSAVSGWWAIATHVKFQKY